MSGVVEVGLGRRTRRGLAVWAWAVFAFLYVPIVVLVVFSFNASSRVNIWGGFSVQWYGEALRNDVITSAIRVSLIVALVSTVVSMVLGTAVALALDRYRFRGRRALDGTVYLPIVIPDITMAVMLLVFFAEAFKFIDSFGPRFTLGISTVALSHIAFNISFVCVVVRARLDQFDRTLEEAARDLYATGWQTFRRVTLPLIMPGVAAGGLLALTLSLDDVVISAFVSGPGSTTLAGVRVQQHPPGRYARAERHLHAYAHCVDRAGAGLARSAATPCQRIATGPDSIVPIGC